MIISGGSRTNWRFFARHLMNARDNGEVEVAEIRGLTAQTVPEALREMDAIASGTRCKNSFYHANMNPRPGEHLSAEQWEQAVDALEHNLGLEGHARFVVEHTKEGRTHRHVVWSRIDPDTMTATSDSQNFRAHERTSRELETRFGLEPVESTLLRDTDVQRPERRPENWETFRGQRTGIDPQTVKEEVTALWNASDSGAAFAAALQERGYILCRGDRRDFCIIDAGGDEHSLARRIEGVKAAAVRARMADIDRDALPSVAEGRALAREHGQEAQQAAAAPAADPTEPVPQAAPPDAPVAPEAVAAEAQAQSGPAPTDATDPAASAQGDAGQGAEPQPQADARTGSESHARGEAHGEGASAASSAPGAEEGRSPADSGASVWVRLGEYTALAVEMIPYEQSGIFWPVDALRGFLRGSGAPDAEATDSVAPPRTIDGYTAPIERAIRSTGSVPAADGVTWWQRAALIVTEVVETAAGWARDRWHSFVDRLTAEREAEPPGHGETQGRIVKDFEPER